MRRNSGRTGTPTIDHAPALAYFGANHSLVSPEAVQYHEPGDKRALPAVLVKRRKDDHDHNQDEDLIERRRVAPGHTTAG
jgi:hypothetical protein